VLGDVAFSIGFPAVRVHSVADAHRRCAQENSRRRSRELGRPAATAARGARRGARPGL